MSEYKEYPPADAMLFGYDPVSELPKEHLVWLVERVVNQAVSLPERESGAGRPAFDIRLTLKVLVYAYCIGVRSSRQMERLCRESLPFLLLTRGAAPSYGTLCATRLQCRPELEEIFELLFAVASECGLPRLGRIAIDSTKLRANASPEAVLRQDEYEAIREELTRILRESEDVDAHEDVEGAATETIVGKSVPADQMRDILRRVRARKSLLKREQESEQESQGAGQGPEQEKVSESNASDESEHRESEPVQEPDRKPVLGQKMRKRIAQAVAAIDSAEKDGRKHLCLTDPDARMLGEGRSKQIRECHSFEVVMDNGLMVVASVTNKQDTDRLLPLVEAALKHEPNGIDAADTDSGYFTGDAVAALEKAGIETCIPNVFTACDLRRGLPIGTTYAKQFGKVPFTYDAEHDCYRCPENNALIFIREHHKDGQTVRTYRAERSCEGCPRAAECLIQKNAKRRTLKVGVDKVLLTAVLERFNDPAHCERYHRRAPAVETTFGFIRSVLGFTSWLLRGTERVLCEVDLFKTAYQFRKIHSQMARETAQKTRMQPKLG